MGMGELWARPLPTSDWVGFQKILDWFFGFPLSLGVGCIGIFIANIGVSIWAKAD
jgi:hypothetical protein